MQRFLLTILTLLLLACNNATSPTPVDSQKTATNTTEEKDSPHSKTYSNDRFKDVTVKKISEDSFNISGKAQVFEATFSWVVEDGHNELLKGFQTASIGAPEWGDFNFGLKAPPKNGKSLHLILFEVSAKDGSRQYELPIPLK